MKALLLLASGAVLMFCLIVLLVSGVLVVRNEKAPKRESKGGESHQPASLQTLERQNGRDLTPPPSQRIEAGARTKKAGALQSGRPVSGGAGEYRGRADAPATLDCAGQTGGNFGPCPGHVSLMAGVQSPGDGSAAGTSGAGACQ